MEGSGGLSRSRAGSSRRDSSTFSCRNAPAACHQNQEATLYVSTTMPAERALLEVSSSLTFWQGGGSMVVVEREVDRAIQLSMLWGDARKAREGLLKPRRPAILRSLR